MAHQDCVVEMAECVLDDSASSFPALFLSIAASFEMDRLNIKS